MIQELLGGGAGLLGGERKISIGHGGVLEGTPTHSPSPSPSPSSSTISTTNTNPNNPASNSDQNQNLRCPRCDSSNTKFCYYNNYNLTQPRHFCKTCRRYWTKGGALRNVPIGGGCRKNKSSGMSASVVKSSAASKVKTLSSEMIGKSGFGNGFDNHDFSSNPLLWTSPQNSHILALLRATQNPNPDLNPNHSSITVKDEGIAIGSNTGALNARNLGLDPLISQAPSIGLCSSFWRNNQHQAQQNHHQHQQENGFIVGHEVQNSSGIQELYQRLRSSTNYYTTDHHAPVIMGNVAASSPSTSSILESAPVVGTDLGYWNPAYSWSDLPTTNGAYP